MAQIAFKGICSGTATKHSAKSGKDYQITSFVEIPSLNKFEVFGNLGLTAHDDARDYVFDAGIVGLSNVVIKVGAVVPVPSPSRKS